MQILSRLLGGRGRALSDTVSGGLSGQSGSRCGGGCSVGIGAGLADGSGQVGGEVQDEFAVNNHVVIRLLEVACQHFYVDVSVCSQ